MRFVEDGPDIPNELIVAQERGEALFVCGAGVSRTIGLPLFRRLVEQVYARLGESWLHHPAEGAGMVAGGELFGQYDRVLRCLERRLAASESPRNRSMKARIRAAVRDELAAPDGADLSNHFALMTLSRDNQGVSRLITTNFDTLFERAWLSEYGSPTASHAGVALPRPMTSGFSGVLHLHGRLADALVQTAETDLVLTSAEFGDAYLRSGWASRYVYDLARTHTLVLVGYQADDPPMRYLLEALEADRELYPDLRRVYAFGEYTDGDDEIKGALWRAKGVEPILYRVDNQDHSPLYATLLEWKGYQEDPTSWRRERLRALLAEHPHPSSEKAIARCIALLDRGDASQLLGDLSPDAAWLPVMVERGMFDKQLPDVWIASRVNDPEMIRACSALKLLDPQTRWRLQLVLDRADNELTAVRERAWRLLLNMPVAVSNSMFDGGWYDWRNQIARGQIDFQARNVIANIVTPRIRLGKPFWWPDEGDEESPETLNKLIRVDLEPADHPPPSEILQAWPDTLEAGVALFRTLDRSLFEALEQATDLGMTGSWDRPSRDIPSIAKHHQNSGRGGFRPIVRAIAELWQRIAAHDPEQARRLIGHWSQSAFLLVRRLHIFALADESWPDNDAARALLGLKDDDFWDDDTQVEIMRLLARRWTTFGNDERAALEGRLCAGVPKTLFLDEATEDEDRWQSIVDNSIYRRLARISSADGVLSDTSNALLEEIRSRHPKWQAEPGDRDDFSVWHTSKVGPDGHPDLLDGVDDDRLVQEAVRVQQESQYDEGDLWRVFCSADPERALRGLRHEGDAHRWDPDAWRYLLWAASEQGDADFQHEVAELVLKMPEATLKEILHAVSSWLVRQRETLVEATESRELCFLKVWDRLADLLFGNQEGLETEAGMDGDLTNEALNRPGGDLASALVDALAATKPADSSGLGHELGPRFLRVVDASNRAGLLGRVYILRVLAYLDAIDPDWTGKYLVPRLDWDHHEALPLWHAYAHGPIGHARLFNALKPAMLQAFERKRLPSRALEGIFSKLFSVAAWHLKGQANEYALLPGEVKRALAIAPEEVRQHAAWKLWRMISDDRVADKAEHWRTFIKPLLQGIWPLDARAKSMGASERLILMALDCDSALPDAVESVLDFIVPYQFSSLTHTLRLETRHQDLFQEHPSAFLFLANAIIDPDVFQAPTDLPMFLEECITLDPRLEKDPAYIRLYGLRRQQNA
ncbi:SIR2 family protein [Stenotrophomonas rhizophila]|uniref:SIR2 family protein n=1 Tax=Stenotrophomonas rhizophila TaxID=216778 RepID=UPI00119E203B|nr:SIR2 family protein [Stenotrophomonas rhizophila]